MAITRVASAVIHADRRSTPALRSVQPAGQPNTLGLAICQSAGVRQFRVLEARVVYAADLEKGAKPDIRRRHCRRRLAAGEDRRSAELRANWQHARKKYECGKRE